MSSRSTQWSRIDTMGVQMGLNRSLSVKQKLSALPSQTVTLNILRHSIDSKKRYILSVIINDLCPMDSIEQHFDPLGP